jgi:large subunit ribosomal protein L20
VIRINAAAREHGLTYGQLIAGLKAAGNPIDRKTLADLAVTEPAAFARLAKIAGEAKPAPVKRPAAGAAKVARPKARAAASARA